MIFKKVHLFPQEKLLVLATNVTDEMSPFTTKSPSSKSSESQKVNQKKYGGPLAKWINFDLRLHDRRSVVAVA